MKLKNVKPLEYNVIQMAKGTLEITTFNQKTRQLIIYKVDDLLLSDDLVLIVDDKTLNMIKALYEQSSISITTDKNVVTIKGKNATYKASMLEKKSLPIINETNLISIKTSLKSLKKASKFVSKSDTKPVLTGVFLQENGKVLATDSYKAYLYNPNDLPTEEKPRQYVIPTWFIDAIQSNDDEVSIKVSPFTAIYENEDMTIYTNLLIGDIQFEQLFIPRTTSELRINKTDISKELSIFASLAEKNAVVKFIVNNRNLTLSTVSELNAYETVIALENGFDTRDILTGFTLEYLQAIVGSCEDFIVITYTDALRLFNVKSGNDRFILLPVKLWLQFLRSCYDGRSKTKENKGRTI